MNVSNARMNIPKDMMSLKSKFFIGITSNPFGRRSTHPVHGVPWKSFYHGSGIFTMVLSCEASLITKICRLAYPAHSIYLYNSLWDISPEKRKIVLANLLSLQYNKHIKGTTATSG